MRIALLLALLTLLAGCCLDPVDGSRYFCFGDVSDEEEAAMGQQYASTFIAESGGVYPDPALQEYLGTIVIDEMAKKSERPDLPWNFTILNTSQINAFALPGGEVFVTRGLLSKLKSEAQFAHLMGHEVGHVTHRHSMKGQGRAAFLGLLVGVGAIADQIVLDDDSPRVFSTVAGTGGQLLFLKYSRDQEIQSDQRGVDYALAAGYDPRAGKRTFEMFLELKGGGESRIENLLSTHPLDSDRIQSIDTYVQSEHSPLPAALVVNSPRFEQALTSIRSAQGQYDGFDKALALISEAQAEGKPQLLDEAERLLRSGKAALPGHAPFPMALGVLALERDDAAGALRELTTATSLDANLFSARLYRGIALKKQGNESEAAVEFLAAHQLHQLHPLPCFMLGSIAEAENKASEAMRWYELTVERSPEGSDLRSSATERLESLSAGG